MTKILVVEDEPKIALDLKEDLKLERYEVTIAGDGDAAIACARQSIYDLILLDIMLPKRDGLQVCRELRRSGIDTPIIFLTARVQDTEKVLGLKLGADDYVTKPFSPMELCARIQAVLRRSQAAAPEVYRFGGMEVDFTRGELRRAGRAVDLTPIEFKMLAVFVRERGRVLTREQIMDKVWPQGVFCTDRVVDTHLSNLRKKIENDASDPRFLISVRGLGYRFDG